LFHAAESKTVKRGAGEKISRKMFAKWVANSKFHKGIGDKPSGQISNRRSGLKPRI
jgi:hypothetical protein